MSRASSVSASSSTPVVADIYRPIATQLQRQISSLTDGASFSTTNEAFYAQLGYSAQTINERLSGKTVLLEDIPSSLSNQTDPDVRKAAAREDQEKRAKTANESGVVGVRKARKRIQSVTGAGTSIDYRSLLPLNYMHNQYMAQSLQLPLRPTSPSDPASQILPISPEALQSKLVKADLTGARLRVRASKNASLSGHRGIVIEETSGSFRLVGEDSRVRVIPKVGSQFTISFPAYAAPTTTEPEDPGFDPQTFVATVPDIEVDILGAAFAFRSGDRAGRKFRPMQGGGGGSGWGEDWIAGEWACIDKTQPARAVNKRRKRNKSRRKDPLAHGAVEVFA